MPDLDARLVQLYDDDNPDGPDHDFFRSLADRVHAHTVVDLGCGTGILTVTLARPGRRVTGIDPSAAMLDHARRRAGAAAVSWVLGDSTAIGNARADVVVMSGNVSQHLTGPTWPAALRDIHDGLRPGGHLAFECRNPADRAWERWTPDQTRTTRHTPVGHLRRWLEVTSTTPDGEVGFAAHTVFTATGEEVVDHQTLAFRSGDTIRADLAGAGLDVLTVRGGWRDEPLSETSRLMVFHARRPGDVPRAAGR